MKTIKMMLVAGVLSFGVVSCGNQPKKVTKADLKTEIDSVSYAIGLDLAKNLNKNIPDANVEIFLSAIRDSKDPKNALMNEMEIKTVVTKYFQKKREEDAKKRREEALKQAEKKYGKEKKEGEEFLKENAKKQGIVTTKSGLQYKVIKQGKGEKPTATSKVKVHYKGTLINGEEFDSSYKRKEPATFLANQVIKGWTEGLQLMQVGSKYQFFIPQELAYGAFPRGGKIKPFMPLIFEVELLEIVKPKEDKKKK
ncbi:MAG: FKBP-type peptidyl-prolyl cis-trans isomerase [Flavobacteriaceae bacterium]|nr:FKBP-type peptidyl-prolyl cis-trans isomerase [Flavobacteriaceae bacterium]